MKSLALLKTSCLALLIAATSVGCFSFKATPDPTQFYVLSPVVDQALQGAGDGISLCIVGVTLPEYLDVPWLVTRENGNRVRRVSFHQWSEPILEGVKRTVVGNLSTALDTSDILVLARERPGESRYFITLTISRFDLSPDGKASLAASWRVRNSATPDFELNNRIERTATFAWDDGDFGAAVGALNDLLAEVCVAVAADVLAKENDQ